MKDFQIIMQSIFAGIGGVVGFLVGGLDGLLVALITLMVIDYLTGVICAIEDKALSSKVGFHGICVKVFILALVCVAHILDAQVLVAIEAGSMCRTAVIFFFLANEGISILENAAHMGLPIPGKIREVLEQLKENAENYTGHDK